MSADAAAPSVSPRLPLAEQVQALRRLALVATRPAGAEIYQDLIDEVARALGVTLALVAVFADERRTTMRTLAAVVHGQPISPVEYPLAKSPCIEVVGKGYRFMPCGVLAAYGSDGMVAQLGLDAYAAFPMNDSRGEPLGLVAVLDPQAIAGGDTDHAEAVLKIAAVRLAAELERSAASEALRRSAASYRAIFEAAEDSILVHDWESFRLVDVNDKAVQSFGYTRDELLAIDPAQLMSGEPPYDMAHALAHLELAKLGRCPPFEWQTRLKGGHLQWQEVRLKPVTIDGRMQILAFARDITERKAAEEKLRASEEQHRSIFNASADAALVKDADHRIVDVNEAYLRMVGYERHELLGQRLSQFVPAELQARCDVLVPEILAGQPCQLEATMLRRDGSRFEVEIRGTPVQYRGSTLALVIMRDITERKVAEARLRNSEEQYRAIFDASTDALVLWNADLRFVDVNRAVCAMYGFTREEVLDTALDERLVPTDQARRMDCMRAALAGQESVLETTTLRKDGTSFDVELRYLPIRHLGEPHVLSIARDITERKRAEAALRAQEQRYRAIFDGSADSMVLWNRRLEVVDVNVAFVRTTGFAREDIVGRHWSTRADADDLRKLLPLIEGALAGREGHTVERVMRADGSLLDFELRYLPMTFNGEPHALGIGRDISQALAADKALRDSEAQYRAIFNASADALVLWNSRFERVDVNAAYLRMYGWSRDDVIGHGYDLPGFTSQYVAPRRDLVRRALAGETCSAVLEARRKDGSMVLTEMHAIPFMHRGEQHVLAIARDLTERAAAETALRASEEQYRAIFNATADALILWNSQFHRVDVNPAFERIYGWSRDEVIGRGFEHVPYTDEDARPRRELVRRALAGEPCRAELQAIRKDGTRIATEVHAIPFTHRGEPHVLAIARDITERKAAEARLSASEEQYRAIFNASADALMLWDSSLKRVDVNPAHQTVFGYAREEVVGRGFEGLDWPPEMAQQRLARVQRALAGEASRVELAAIRKGGEQIVTELRTIPFQHRGEPHVLQIARDVTGQRAAEAERSALEAQLRQAQKMEAIGQLTGGIAHDFNNILTSVIGYIVLAQERAERQGDATLVRQLGSAQTAAQRARELIAQMLAFARRQRGDRRVIALAPVLRQALQLLRSTMPASITLDDAGLGEGPELPPVQADAVQIEQVLFNLCINARDAMQRSGRIAVRLGTARRAAMRCTSCGATVAEGRWLELEVTDNGSGIAPEVLPRMFEPFFSTKEVGRGSGMGLAMVHGIVHDHGGHVVVDSVPGRGSAFRVLLPSASGAADVAAPLDKAPDAEAPLRGRVMLVEDEPMVAAFMRELLEGWGLEVVAPADARAAARWFDDPDNEVELLLTDLTMPQMTGIELSHHVGVLRPDLPVLLYSGDAEGLDDDALRRAGVRARLDKPVDPPRLKSLLQRWLGAR
jgi:PAS domain S-box-containing protein